MVGEVIGDFIRASPDPAVGFDASGRIALANGLAENLFRCAPGGLLGKDVRTVLPGLDVPALLADPAGRRLETQGRRRDDSGFPVSVSLTPLPGAWVVAVVRETSAMLDSERAARAEAERANLLKDHFLATLSHELRTPLNAMLGWTQLLRSRGSDPDIAERAVETIDRNIRHQTRLIEDLLDIYGVGTGKISLDVKPMRLAPIVESVLEIFAPAAKDKGVELGDAIDDDVPEVAGDSHRLQQVLRNLVSNALKFTPKRGRITVSLRQVGSFARMEVTDSGEGIDSAFLPYVFERFRQADSSVGRRHEGLGLGLSIVRGLVELHGGSVIAESRGKGQGATFVVLIPLAGEEGADVPTTPFAAAANRARSLAGLRVLVVDDSADSLEFLSRVLESFGAEVYAAASADEGMAAVLREHPDVILCDIGMPGEDGYQFIRRVRGLDREHGGATPAAALTAFTRAQDRARAIESGFQDHVAKPAEPVHLVEVVRSLAGSGKGRSPA